jgi:hypothetical protein
MNPAKFIGLIVGGLIAGALCGLIPFFVGKKRGQTTLGNAGLVCSIIGGAIGGIILALPVAGVFALIIAARPVGQTPGTPPGAPPGPGPIG